MKKLIVGLLAAFLMTTGLAAFTTGSATAACPYTGCAPTSTDVSGPTSADPGDRVTYTAEADVANGGRAATPKGTFVFTLKGVKGKAKGSYFSQSKAVGGGTKRFTTPKLQRGKYAVTIRFVKKKNSAFSNSVDKLTLTVK